MRYQVADYIIDTALFRISSGGAVVPVEPKVFDLLVHLIQHRERVLSREELFQAVWDGREVSDATLSNHIKIARKALGDSGELQRTIQTVRGRGYQFVAPVVELPDLTGGSERRAPAAPEQVQPSKPKLWATWVRPLAAAVLLLAGAGLGMPRLLGPKATPGTQTTQGPSIPYVLVVPFEFSGAEPGPADQHWADELSRRVIANLREITGLRVKERATSFTLQNRTHDYIRSALPDVRYVLDGIVIVSADGVLEITVYLNDLEIDRQLWHGNYRLRRDASIANLADIQSTIATVIPRVLKVKLLEEEQLTLGRSRELSTQNRKALELYMEGWTHLPLLNHASVKKAIELFDAAIALDGDFYDAHMAKGEAELLIYSYWDIPELRLPRVVASFERAHELRSEAAEPLAALGLTYAMAWEWNKAWDYLNRARAGGTTLAMTELGFAVYYAGLGQAVKVKQSLHRARESDPYNLLLADWGNWALFFVGENDASREWSADMMAKHEGVGFITTDAAIGAYMGGDHERAIDLAEKGHVEDPSALAKVALAQAYGFGGQPDKVLPLMKEAESMGTYVCPYESAVAYLSINDKKKAMELLEDAYNKRSNCLVFLRVDPRFEPLRQPPFLEQFLDLLARVGLDDKSFDSYPK